jgi:CheY-like chemotaxis protein
VAMTKRKVLLVIDDWELLERYEDAFSREFEILCAPFGPEGIALARSERPGLILLNLAFEMMTNEEAQSLLQSDPVTQKIPVLVVGDEGVDYWLTEALRLKST